MNEVQKSTVDSLQELVDYLKTSPELLKPGKDAGVSKEVLRAQGIMHANLMLAFSQILNHSGVRKKELAEVIGSSRAGTVSDVLSFSANPTMDTLAKWQELLGLSLFAVNPNPVTHEIKIVPKSTGHGIQSGSDRYYNSLFGTVERDNVTLSYHMQYVVSPKDSSYQKRTPVRVSVQPTGLIEVDSNNPVNEAPTINLLLLTDLDKAA